MTARNAIRVMVVLAATAAFAQSALPGTTQGAPILSQQDLTSRRGPARNRGAGAAPQGLAAIQQQVEDTDHTLSQMRVLLKQMQTRAAKTKATDSVTKANLEMWGLMVGQMDKELQQLRSTLAAREDMEARRAALYKQADAKIEAQAQAARTAQAARFAEATKNATGTQTTSAAEPTAGQGAQQDASPHTAPAQSSTVPPASNPASPN